MKIRIEKSAASGVICAPPAKSFAHRQLICAAFSDGESVIRGVQKSEDVSATLDCVKALGAEVLQLSEDTVKVRGITNNTKPQTRLFCRESGSTLRFFIPICLTYGREFTLTGSERLLQRPLSVYEKLCSEKGLYFKKDDDGIRVKGPLNMSDITVDGSVSSQFITGLLLAAPLMKNDLYIKITPPFVSRPYVDITLEVMRNFGVAAVYENELTLFIKGGQKYKAASVTVEGDCSNAAFLDALGIFGGVTVTGLNENSVQGDMIYKKYFEKLKNGFASLDIADCPDNAPVLMALGAALHGVTLKSTTRLKIKESDRGAAMAEELEKFGVKTEIGDDFITVFPACLQRPCRDLSSHNDHRIVMALSVLLTLTGGRIDGAEAVNKSYPEFFEDIKKLGIGVTYET